MRTLFITFFLLFLSRFGFAQIQNMYLGIIDKITHSEVTNTRYDAYFPRYTIGHHKPDTCLKFISDKYNTTFIAKLPEKIREAPSGDFSYNYLGRSGVYHLSSGAVPSNLNDSIAVSFYIQHKTVLVKGKIFKEKGLVKFKDYFEAREFPFFYFPHTNYEIEYIPLNELDTVRVVYAWADTSILKFTETKETETDTTVLEINFLDSVKVQTKKAIAIAGNIAPNFWHKHLQNWGGIDRYTIMFFLGSPYMGLEHFSSPVCGLSQQYIDDALNLVLHEVIHSFIGKATMPPEYMSPDGRHIQADALCYYEGLTTYLDSRAESMDKYSHNFGYNISKSKSFSKDDLRSVSLYDSTFETYYYKGLLYWMTVNSKSDEFELYDWLKWLFEDKLYYRQNIPIPTNLDSVFNWLDEYSIHTNQDSIGIYARKIADGKYIEIIQRIVAENGFSPHYFKNDSSYCWAYIGPYPLYEHGWVLDVDTYGIKNGTLPVSVVTTDNDTLPLFKATNEKGWSSGQKYMEENPDSVYTVIMSNGKVVKTAKNAYFPDGSDFYYFSKIDTSTNPKFWKKHCTDWK